MSVGTHTRPKTRTISGHKLKLAEGRRYLALGPLPSRDSHGKYDVPIADVTGGANRFDAPAAVVTRMDHAAAARLRAQFNECQYGGRTW